MAHSSARVSIPLPPPASLAERFVSPFQRFARFEASSGVLLLFFAALALVIANSAWGHGFHELLATPITLGFGESWSLRLSVEQWINDALMAAFFFLVGLEIKREALVGELSNLRKAALPVIAAAGGMLVPGLIYASFNWGEPTIRGWGIPTATDIAFSLGVLALLGKRVPAGVRVFLATLAIADDIGALLVIAIFYTETLYLDWLIGAGTCLGIMIAFNLGGVRRAWPYAIVGLFLWYFVLRSGVHATIAGVLGAMTIPVRTRVDGKAFASFTREAVNVFERAAPEDPRGLIANSGQQAAVQGIEDACDRAQTPLHQLEHAMSPWIAFVVIPIFALANAGVEIAGNFAQTMRSHETLGVALGLCLGKPVGITLASLAAVGLRLGQLPAGVTWRHIHGAAWLGGIGFTMSLFIATLAFPSHEVLDHAKIGIIAGSIVSAVVGFLILRAARPAGKA